MWHCFCLPQVRKKFGLDTENYNWCLTGNAGAGKSTLANTLRGLRPGQPGAAKTGVTETTHVRTAYDMPNYPYAKLWDLPGGGTEAHRAEKYFEEERIDVFDAVIIVTKDRFTQFDKFLCDICKERKVPFFCVRTRADRAIEDDMHDNGWPEPRPEETMRKLRARMVECVGEAYKQQIFVVSGLLNNMGQYDMPGLIHAVLHATASSRVG